MLRVLVGGCVILSACATTPRFDGPLAARNQHPAQLVVLHVPPAGASPLARDQARFRIDAAYSSLFLAGTNGGDSLTMDGEVLRSSLGCRYGLGGGLEAWVEFPWALTTGGFLDDFVIDFHDAFGFPDAGRPQAPRDQYRIDAQSGGPTVFEVGKERGALLDVPFGASWSFLPVTAERPFGFAAHAALELPVGNEDRGFGSGRMEGALGVSAELRAGPSAWTAFAQHAFAQSPKPARRAGFEFRDVTSIGGSVELALNDHLAALVQAEWETSTLRELDLLRANRDQAMLWTGVRGRVSRRLSFEVAFGEDLIGDISPDFSAYVAMVLRLGGPGSVN